MKKTPLYEKHIVLGARMAPFGGYIMPIQYRSILHEHERTRHGATVFDTCHMGEFSIHGQAAAADLERILSCPVASLTTGRCRYGLICNEKGGVIDDQILYRTGESEFLMVVNAGTQSADFDWITRNLSEGTGIRNISEEMGKIDLQGPLSPRICAGLFEESIRGLKYYHFMINRYRGEKVLLSRTGYTGETGFEFYGPPDLIVSVWDACIAAGAEPAGLGARDTLRLEMGYPLYGHELDPQTNASWAGLSRAIGDKRFIGSHELKADRSGPSYRLSAIEMEGRRTAHQGDPVRVEGGRTPGRITSGSYSPSLGRAIALGYLPFGEHHAGNRVVISTDRGDLSGTVTTLPFYRQATGRTDLDQLL